MFGQKTKESFCKDHIAPLCLGVLSTFFVRCSLSMFVFMGETFFDLYPLIYIAQNNLLWPPRLRRCFCGTSESLGCGCGLWGEQVKISVASHYNRSTIDSLGATRLT